MIISMANPIIGYAWLSDEHAASSYGIPVLINGSGKSYGPNDQLFESSALPWLAPDIRTAADLVRAYGLADWDYIGTRDDHARRIAFARKFLAAS